MFFSCSKIGAYFRCAQPTFSPSTTYLPLPPNPYPYLFYQPPPSLYRPSSLSSPSLIYFNSHAILFLIYPHFRFHLSTSISTSNLNTYFLLMCYTLNYSSHNSYSFTNATCLLTTHATTYAYRPSSQKTH